MSPKSSDSMTSVSQKIAARSTTCMSWRTLPGQRWLRKNSTAAADSQPGFRHHEGADNLFLLRRDLTTENLTVRPGGRGDALTGPGLGVHVRQDTLIQLSRQHAVAGAPSRTRSA